MNLLNKINNDYLTDTRIPVAEIEMIILEHSSQFRTSKFGHNISIESHYIFCNKRCFLINELINIVVMPNCIIDLIIEY